METITEIKQGYKKTKVGWIPKEWEFLEVENFLDRSKTKHNPKNSDLTFPCIELENIEKEKGFINGYTSSADQLSIKNKFNTGEVLFGKLRPYLKKYWLAEFEGVCSSEIWVLKGKDKTALNEFVFYLIQQHRFIQASNMTSGSKMPRADWEFLSKFPFPLPPLPEQQKIAKIISTWDKAIEQNQKLIEQLKARKKGLMQQLLTGKTRLKSFNGEWKEYSYNSLLKEVRRPVKWDDEELYHLISVRRRSGGLFHRESLYGRDILTKNLKTAKTGDYLISKMQILHGASGLTSEKFDGMKISGSYISLRARNEKDLNMEFFSWLSQMPYFYHQTYISSYGVHIEKMTFDFKTFLKLKTSIPLIEEQTAITKILSTADDEIKTQESYLAQLQAQKKGLMQQLLTGQKRVAIN